MTTPTRNQAPSRARLQLIALLLALSTVLFVVGSAVERSFLSGAATADIHQETEASPEASEGEGTHTEAGENAEAGQAPAHSEAAEPTIAGIDLESPWVVAAVVLLTVLLIAALWRFGYPVLFVVLVVALLAMIADVREVIVQAGLARYDVATLATAVAVAHLATAIVTMLALREGRTTTQAPAVNA